MINNQIQRTTLTMKEASEYLGISYWLINQLVRKKQIPYCKVGVKAYCNTILNREENK